MALIKVLSFFLCATAASAAGSITVGYQGFQGGCLMDQSVPAIATGITGLGSDTVVATADAYYSGNPLPSASDCLVTVWDDLIASGPAGEQGFLTISLFGDGENTTAPFYVNGVAEGGCGPIGCSPGNMTIPVTLGTPFEIRLEANAAWAGAHQCCFGASDLEATLQVYQVVDGFQFYGTVSDVGAVATPEPKTVWLALLGLAITCGRRFTRHVRAIGFTDSTSPATAGSASG
jgi:hypothetical protein